MTARQKLGLGLWMNGAFVGTWSASSNGVETLQYDLGWTQSEQGRALSLSLPFTPGNLPHKGDKVRFYFENLLPDSKEIRERVARRFRTNSTDAFDLLSEVGRDCVGALQIYNVGDAPAGLPLITAKPLSDAEVAKVLRAVTAPAGMQSAEDAEEFRISIAGAQEKTALLYLDGKWCLPQGATPTSHIFKLPMGLIGGMMFDMRHSVENEWLCSLIVRAYGLPVARCEPLQFEDTKVLSVERFDRVWWTSPAGVRSLIRLPQEDMCQATGTPGLRKYQSDGGPGIEQIMKLLETSMDPLGNQRIFFQAQIIFWMLRAVDGHAKNFSLFLRPRGAYELTPLYDVLSAYPIMGHANDKLSPFKAKMAMAVRSKNVHYLMRDIHRRHWLAVGKRHGIRAANGQSWEVVVDDIVARTPEVIASVSALLPPDFPAEVADPIFDGLRETARQLAI